jgi:ATP-dependent Clp protease ATP-binding subunit ClpC
MHLPAPDELPRSFLTISGRVWPGPLKWVNLQKLMTDEIQALIDGLRRGQYEDPAEKIGLLAAALQEQNADVSFLLSLLRAPQISLRLAAMEGSRHRDESELLSEFAGMAQHPEVRIRTKLAEILQPRRNKSTAQLLTGLLQDPEAAVRKAALKNTSGLPEFRAAQETCLKSDSDWTVRLAAANALEKHVHPEVIRTFFASILQDDDSDIGQRCAELIEKRMESSHAAAVKQLPSDISQLSKAHKRLEGYGAHRFPRLTLWLAEKTTVQVDPEALSGFGTDLTSLSLSGELPHAYDVDEVCDHILKLLQREHWRSLVLLGPAGVGKTAVVNELVYRLALPQHGGWRVLRVSPTDFMSETRYLGEWETKVRNLVASIRKPRHVLLYVPNIGDLAAAGTWSKSDSSVATALAPYMEEGSIVLIGESSPEEYERGLGRIPSLRRLLDRVLLQEISVERTRGILTSIRDEEDSSIPDELLDQIVEVSGQFLSHVARPGNAVELMRAVIKEEKKSGEPLTFRDALNCLSSSTGIPAGLMDDAVPLNTLHVREFFEKKVIGQPEAIEAVVDLVTLIKASLTDPGKPFGVFLFVGPTGVGKTELARGLAEFIFGDAARLKRFDMSEFAGPDGFTRLIGGKNENGILTDAIRQHPFSVVLFDEIEKAHLNVFDLCLQIFDAGRLTDGRGRTVDFRRSIVILTSNIGSTAWTPTPGFLPRGISRNPVAQNPAVDTDRTFRELSRFFRPEFLNRLDRIIQFRPLSLQVAEQIARREIDTVLQRSGIRRRHLVVDVDPSVVSLLVREGYSPHFGARPLKRTVERVLLLPLARAISKGALKERTVLRLIEQNGTVETRIANLPISKESERIRPDPQNPSTRSIIASLHERYDALELPIRVFVERKSELIGQIQDREISKDPEARTAIFNEIHILDHFLSVHQDIGRSLRALPDKVPSEKLEVLESDIEYLALAAHSKDAVELGDAMISISLVDRIGPTQNSVEKLAGMYRALAARRRMTAEVLGEFYNERQDHVYLLTAGLGAYGLLKGESGLHRIDRRYKERTPRTNREIIREDRELVRIEIHPAANKVPQQFCQQLKTKLSTLRPARTRLIKTTLALALFHEPSVRSLELWTNGSKEDALERGASILYAIKHQGVDTDSAGIIRQYDLGIGAKIKDNRTGRTTTRIKQFFNGNVGPMLLGPWIREGSMKPWDSARHDHSPFA